MNRRLFLLGLRHMIQGRTGIAAMAISLIPLLAVIILFVRDAMLLGNCPCTWDAGISDLVTGMVLGVTVPLTALLLAGGVLTDEMEDGTISYLLTRPISRRQLYRMRVLPVVAVASAAAAAQVAMVGLGRWVAYIALVPAGTDVTWDAFAIGTGMMAAALQATALCAVLSAINLYARRWRFTLGLLYLLAWELPAGLTGGLGFLTAYHHAAVITSGAWPGMLVGVPWLLLWAAVWFWAAQMAVERRSIRVASAA